MFAWDPKAGTVTGPSAEELRAAAKPGAMVSAHPMPWGLRLGRSPMRSSRDMALLVGVAHRLPDALVEHYPKAPKEPTAQSLDGAPAPEVVF